MDAFSLRKLATNSATTSGASGEPPAACRVAFFGAFAPALACCGFPAAPLATAAVAALADKFAVSSATCVSPSPACSARATSASARSTSSSELSAAAGCLPPSTCSLSGVSSSLAIRLARASAPSREKNTCKAQEGQVKNGGNTFRLPAMTADHRQHDLEFL
eukprot:6175914-Pleurochrysis_carterae.AAC.1